MKTGAKKSVRCAIYTRVSTDQGLEQDFNSLDAQYDASQAYIRSQAHAGWSLLRAKYDDGGFSGGNTDRPALQRLLEDVRAGRVDIIVVYKVDRLWLLGYPDQALRICAEARRYAERSQHPFSEAMARTIALRVHQLRGEAAVVASQANEAIALCEEHGFVHYLAMAQILRGWASAQQDEFEKGIAEIQAGLEKERATGALLFESYTLGLLADACIKNGRYGQALDFLNQAQVRL